MKYEQDSPFVQSGISECVGVGGPSITGPVLLVSMVRGWVCTVHSMDCLVNIDAPCTVLTSAPSTGIGWDITRGNIVGTEGGPGAFDVVTPIGAGTIDGVLCGFDNGEDSDRHMLTGVEGICWIGWDINLGKAFASSTGPTEFCSIVDCNRNNYYLYHNHI